MPKPLPTAPQSTVHHRTHIFYFVLAGIVAAFAMLTYFASRAPYFPIDLQITLALQQFQPTGFDGLMRLISAIGEIIPGTTLLLLAAGFLWFKGHKKEGIMVLVSTFGAEAIGLTFKHLVNRVRPDPTLIRQVVHYTTHDSFPSGHVLYYVGFYGFLFYLTYTLFSKSPWHRLCLIIFGLLIILVGFSRIYLGAHWFSDVMGAYLIGFVWLTVVVAIYHRLHLKSLNI